MKAELVDLSHTIHNGMITYRGLPAPVVCDFMSHSHSREHYGEGTEFHIGEVQMVSNTGTYIDSPYHRFPDGVDVARLPLESLAALDGVLIQPRPSVRAIDTNAFRGVDVEGKAVLVKTGWDRHWRTDRYFEGHPFLTEAAADHLLAGGAKLLGIDSLNIDNTDDPMRPVHTRLLGAGIPVVEHLRGLAAVEGRAFTFYAVPVKISGMGTFPVRAFAQLRDSRR